MSLKIEESMRLPSKGELHNVAICDYKKDKKCEKPATVFVTTAFGKKKYCGYHFSLTLFQDE